MKQKKSKSNVTKQIHNGLIKESRSNVTNQIHNDLIKEKGNDPKPSYAEIEELVENYYFKSNSDSRQPTRRRNKSYVETAAKIYVMRYRVKIIAFLVFLLLLTLMQISGRFGFS
ncbi:MAG: hypothetical protein K6348_03065 [Deferribacterales bacterium]